MYVTKIHAGILAAFAGVVLALMFLLVTSSAGAAGNLVANGNLETASGTAPANWSTDSWGTLTAKFTYPTPGQTGNGARIDISGYKSGDAKWQHAAVPVTAGAVYQISDSYMSSVPSEIDIEYKSSSGALSYAVLASPASTAGAWKNFSGQVTVPAGTVSMTVLHLIQSNGYLVIDNLSVSSGTTPPPPPPPSKPTITSFSANPANIIVGNSSTLAWSVTGATLLTIDQGVGTVTGTSKVVSPSATTTYTLTASNAGGTSTAQTFVNVGPVVPPPPLPPLPAAPGINSFVATPQTITAGQNATLSWSVTGATLLTIDQGVGTVTGTSKAVSPSATTTYTITASNSGGTTTAQAMVKVAPVVIPPPPVTPTTTPTTTPPVVPPPPSNLIQNGNLETGSTNAPQGWVAGSWGTLTAKFTYPVTGKGGGKAAQVQISKFTDGAANWVFNHITSNSHTMYQFSEDYMATVPTEFDVEFLMADGSYQYQWLANLPASSSWQTVSAQITVPTGAVSFTVVHILAKVGTLTVDNASLTVLNDPFAQGMVTFAFDDGFVSPYTNALPILKTAGMKAGFYIITKSVGGAPYMTWAQIKSLATQGYEVGSHTRTHPALTTFNATQLQSEVKGSYTDLVAQGITPKVLVYPLGDVNASVETAVKNAGYAIARGSYYGLNTPHANKYNLYDIRLDKTSKLADVQKWIDQAKADKRWLVFELHDVKTGGDEYAITPAFFQSVVTYVKQSGIKVVTLDEGRALMAP